MARSTPSIRLFITVYKNTLFLKKVLDSVAQQTYSNFKVSVLEDGDSIEMAEFIKNIHYSFSIEHHTQEDLGFRKNKILNVGLRNATEDLIVFIDGDCILHPSYLSTYAKYYDSNTVLFAKRTNLDETTSKQLLETTTIVPSKWKMLRNGSTRIEDSVRLPFKPIFTTNKPRLLGCNMAIPLTILTSINGFDEDYEMTGYGEDCDIEWRILKAGYIFKNLKYHSIQFHLYHERPEREDQTAISRAMYHSKIAEGNYYCKNGLEKIK